MTHAESQDLLLDLAYGELDAERAAEVASHLEACAECQKEKAALEETRRMAAPLRGLEEPSPGFDDRILAAARAQAQLEHDGNVGQVIEVTGSVHAMGLEAARIDAHGPVKARSVERRRPRWLTRVALGGSVAAAAALALVVNSTLETRRSRERAAEARSDEYAIRVQPAAPQSLDTALRDAERKREKEQVRPTDAETAAQEPSRPSAALQKDKVAQLRAPKAPRQAAGGSGARAEGSGGDVAERVPSRPAATASRVENDAKRGQVPAAAGGASAGLKSATPPAAAYRVMEPDSRQTVPVASSQQAESREGFVEPPPPAVPRAMKSAPAVPAAAPAQTLAAGGIEANAQQARHAGEYVLAASLYRQAAALRQRENDPAGAAWNLAHAVECLSAVGQLDEARGVREELARSYPSETTALSAARRALREVAPPAPAPASKQR